MDREKIALDFIRVYKEYKDRNFRTRKLKGEEKGEPVTNQSKKRKSRIGEIDPE